MGQPGIATLLHLVSWLLAVSVSAQPVFAGLFLDGHDAWRAWHAGNGMLLLPLLALTQLVLAVLAWRTGRGPGWLPPASLALLLAAVAQNLARAAGSPTRRIAFVASALMGNCWREADPAGRQPVPPLLPGWVGHR